MSIPVPPTFERTSLDGNQRTIARSLLTLVENLTSFEDFITTFQGANLEEPPYSYTADEAYALRRFAELGGLYARIFEDGGSLDVTEAALLGELTHKSAGAIVFTSSGM